MNLNEIHGKQAELQELMDWPAGEPTMEGNQVAAKDHLLAAMMECSEAMDELNWKTWKPKDKKVDIDAYTSELTDILQFVVNAAIMMNISAHDMEISLRAKWIENVRRINHGL